jgi:hypothetical protein
VTFGWKEVHDLHAVLTHLKNNFKTPSVVIWGRQMGAATALMYNDSPIEIKGLILDSGFADF